MLFLKMAFERSLRHFFKIFRVRFQSKENSNHLEWLNLTLHTGRNGCAIIIRRLPNIRQPKEIKSLLHLIYKPN
ncbi:MAG: hypothetical protein ACI9WO_001917 [Sphingobacteriales bacterium]|jgi:hypothetical protein